MSEEKHTIKNYYGKRDPICEKHYPIQEEEIICPTCGNTKFSTKHFIHTSTAIYGEVSRLILLCPCGFSKEFILEG